jgi:hypothetical protein
MTTKPATKPTKSPARVAASAASALFARINAARMLANMKRPAAAPKEPRK